MPILEPASCGACRLSGNGNLLPASVVSSSAFKGQSLLSIESDLLQGGMNKKRLHYIEGGHHGNREQYINNLVRIMN